MEIQEKEMTEEERWGEVAEKWKSYVRSEVNAYLDSFLDLAIEGNIGVKYKYGSLGTYEDGKVDYDKNQAVGVQILLDFKFETPLFFTDEKGFTNK